MIENKAFPVHNVYFMPKFSFLFSASRVILSKLIFFSQPVTLRDFKINLLGNLCG